MLLKKDKVFTLAEVLIALVVIGVVVSITIANITQSYQEQTNLNNLKKHNLYLTKILIKP